MTHDPWFEWGDAPKTGEEILVYYPNQKVYLLVSFNKVRNYWQSKGDPQLGIDHQGCVWRPLPQYSGEGIAKRIEVR